MTAITIQDPSAFLRASEGSDAYGRMIDEIKGNCGLILQGIEWMCEKLGFSLLELIMKPIAGDFNSIDDMKNTWGRLAGGIDVIAENYRTLKGSVGSAWVAPAATRAEDKLGEMARGHAKQAEALRLMERQLGNMLAATKSIVAAVASALSIVEEILLSMTVAKFLKELITLGGGLRKAVETIRHAVRLIDSLSDVLPPIFKACAVMATLWKVMNTFFMLPVVAARQATAGNHADDTADAGF